MEFWMSQVTKITKVTRDKCEKWMQEGFVTPSIRRASGRGTRNIFSVADLYLIALFKKLGKGEAGFYREKINEYLQSIKMADIERLSMASQLLRMSPLRNLILFGEISREDKLLKRLAEIHSEDPEIVRKKLIRIFTEIAAEVRLFMAFVQRNDSEKVGVESFPIVESKQKQGKGLAYPFSFIADYSVVAENIFFVNFGNIIDAVDWKIYEFYPDKLRDHFDELIKIANTLLQEGQAHDNE